jgi:hypothetical protein
MTKEILIATVHTEHGSRRFTATGRQVCRTLRALIEAGDQGITALEVSSWALRLAHEPHEGGHHGRYRLISRVTLDAESEAA